MNRPNWDEYFLNIAKAVATRSTCPRASVGAVIVRDRRIIATGYNGAPAGEPHCISDGCILEREGQLLQHCQRAVHAETNAVAQAAKFGLAIEGAILYFWDSLGRRADSCVKCSQIMNAAGIVIVIGRHG